MYNHYRQKAQLQAATCCTASPFTSNIFIFNYSLDANSRVEFVAMPCHKQPGK